MPCTLHGRTARREHVAQVPASHILFTCVVQQQLSSILASAEQKAVTLQERRSSGPRDPMGVARFGEEEMLCLSQRHGPRYLLCPRLQSCWREIWRFCVCEVCVGGSRISSSLAGWQQEWRASESRDKPIRAEFVLLDVRPIVARRPSPFSPPGHSLQSWMGNVPLSEQRRRAKTAGDDGGVEGEEKSGKASSSITRKRLGLLYSLYESYPSHSLSLHPHLHDFLSQRATWDLWLGKSGCAAVLGNFGLLRA